MSDTGPGERSAPEGPGGQPLPPPSLSPYGAPPPGAPPPPGQAPPPPPPGYNPYAAPYTYATTPPSADGPAPGLRYAGFGVRTLAYLIDSVLLGIVIAIAAIPLGGLTRDGTTTITSNGTVTTVPTANPSLQLFAILAGAVYFVIAWGFFARTLGMRALRLQVLRTTDGLHIGIGRALLRYVGLLISFFCAFLGVIWVALDPRRQGWHDKMAGTFVVQETRSST
ncbi:MAG TPA: RDD family protein [Candidatus Dormibacteraeota bacterium]|jgi:uncharacterized RDD family membrane protein YckC|nr:RDD family protein [Candidatus Dormibacteraeota bacterium]